MLDPPRSSPPATSSSSPEQAIALLEGEATGAPVVRPPNVPVNALYSADSANLDLLRSAAAFFVLLFHVLLFFMDRIPANLDYIGRWGVLMFFVHTSFVLMLSLERQRSRWHGVGLFRDFMVRRCFRLLPLSMLVVALVVGLDLPVGHLRGGSFIRVTLGPPGILSNLFLVQNLTQTDSVMATLWSLPYEMQMYLTLPMLYLFARKSRSMRPLLALWIACVCFAFVWMRMGREDLFDFPQYVPCFLAGVIAFRLESVTRRSWPALLWPAVLALLTFLYLLHPSRSVGILDCLVLGALIPRFRELPGKRTRRVLQLVARYSYGLYLTHFICLWFAFDAMRAYAMPIQWGMFVVTVVGLPVFLYHAVEAPMISVGVRVAQWLRSRLAPSAVPG